MKKTFLKLIYLMLTVIEEKIKQKIDSFEGRNSSKITVRYFKISFSLWREQPNER